MNEDLQVYNTNVGGLKKLLQEAKIDRITPTPLDKDAEKRHEKKVSSEKNTFMRQMEKDEEARLGASVLAAAVRRVWRILRKGGRKST